jgi:hydroxyacylglutathione hydrolase
MIHEVLAVGPLQCNCSILGDEVSREAIVVDPGDELHRIRAVLDRHGLTVKQIVVTHAHIDHIAGAQRLKQLTGAPVLYNQLDLPLVKMMDVQAAWLGMAPPEVAPPDDDLVEGRIIGVGMDSALGNPASAGLGGVGIVGEILHTPGHTQGSVCLHLPRERVLLAGDTLFAGSVGRTDLPGGDHGMLLRSIRGKLLGLAEETVVVPGHGPQTTIGAEKERNPFLR